MFETITFDIGDLVECSVFGAAASRWSPVGIVIAKDRDEYGGKIRVRWHDGLKRWERASELKLVAKAKNGI